MRKRVIDGCPISGALQMIGDKWTLLVVRELAHGPRRTMELINGLFPISSRTLVQRLRDMEADKFVVRHDFGGNPQHIEYELTQRGRILLSMMDVLRKLGEALECHECEDRKAQLGDYCSVCPNNLNYEPHQAPNLTTQTPPRRSRDDSIVLL